MSAQKTLLVVDSGVKLPGAAYEKLAAAGYVVVRGNPSQFHVMESIPSGQLGAVLDAALATLRVDYSIASGKDVRDRFARELLNRLSAAGGA